MKKIFVMLAMLMMTLVANAQFEKGKHYLSASVNNFERIAGESQSHPDHDP